MEIWIPPETLTPVRPKPMWVSSAYQDIDMRKLCWEVFPDGQISNHRAFFWLVPMGCMVNIPAVHFSYEMEERHTANPRKGE